MRFNKIKNQPIRPIANGEQRDNKELARSNRGFQIKILIPIVLLLIGLIFYWYWKERWIVTKGRVMATRYAVSTTHIGRINRIFVNEGEEVRKGQVIAELDGGNIAAEILSAETQVHNQEAILKAMQESDVDPTIAAKRLSLEQAVSAAQAAYNATQARLKQLAVIRDNAATRLTRKHRLFALKAITRDDLEQALANSRATQAEYEATKAELPIRAAELRKVVASIQEAQKALEYAEQGLQADINKQQLALDNAKLALQQSQTRLNETQVIAAHNGRIAWKRQSDGDVVDHNDIIAEILDTKDVWIESYVYGDDLDDMVDGMEADIAFDGMVQGTFKGKIIHIYPTERLEEEKSPVGFRPVRSPPQLGNLFHPIKIKFEGNVPQHLQPEMVARVKIRRQ